MASLKKRCNGCWICRLRRKKCDEARPECAGCKTFEIACHYSLQKPGWMDGGPSQREMSERIKAQIKQSANCRRERHAAQAVTTTTPGMGDHNFVVLSNREFAGELAKLTQPRIHAMSEDVTSSLPRTRAGMEEAANLPREDAFAVHSLIPVVSDKLPSSSCDASGLSPARNTQSAGSTLSLLDELPEDYVYVPLLSQGRDYEIDFLMKYLDYVFPFLFPFYQPALLETGRSWLLSLLNRSRVALHSVLSLSSYFFTVALSDAYPGRHEGCKAQLWAQLVKQSDRCFEMIKQDVQELSLRGTQAKISEKVRVMESIILFLIFEVIVSRSANWNLHLTPALALFEDILHVHAPESSTSKMSSVLDVMAKPSRYSLERDHYVWSPEQAGFRFFTALLVFIDTIASTSLEQPPRLLEYYSHLCVDLEQGAPENSIGPILLPDVVGCQNWAILAIGKISALDAWKKDAKKAGSLSMVELVERASHIAQELSHEISRLDRVVSASPRQDPIGLQFYFHNVRPTSLTSSTTPTKIWAHAAQIYLAVVVSGWQLSTTEVRSGVAKTLELLQTEVSSAHLRTLAWPICVAGCMAEVGSHEQGFHDLLAGMSGLEMIGPLDEARRVMEKVWQNREAIDRETWDLASCFRILGAPVLLF